jgi:hypothetical protein
MLIGTGYESNQVFIDNGMVFVEHTGQVSIELHYDLKFVANIFKLEFTTTVTPEISTTTVTPETSTTTERIHESSTAHPDLKKNESVTSSDEVKSPSEDTNAAKSAGIGIGVILVLMCTIGLAYIAFRNHKKFLRHEEVPHVHHPACPRHNSINEEVGQLLEDKPILLIELKVSDEILKLEEEVIHDPKSGRLTDEEKQATGQLEKETWTSTIRDTECYM